MKIANISNNDPAIIPNRINIVSVLVIKPFLLTANLQPTRTRYNEKNAIKRRKVGLPKMNKVTAVIPTPIIEYTYIRPILACNFGPFLTKYDNAIVVKAIEPAMI